MHGYVDALSFIHNRKKEVKESIGIVSHTLDKQYDFIKKIAEDQLAEFERNEHNDEKGANNSVVVILLFVCFVNTAVLLLEIPFESNVNTHDCNFIVKYENVH